MALSATISKVDLNIIDMDRHYYQQHDLILAQHPSETVERLALRLLAFACHANELLSFTKGLSSDDEPDLWEKSLSDEINVWIELGLPSEKRLKKACGRAKKVIVYAYGAGSATQWWDQMEKPLSRFNNLCINYVTPEISHDLAALLSRKVTAQVTIQDGDITWDADAGNREFRIERWRE